MTSYGTKRLRELASKATPGPWEARYGRFYGDNVYVVQSATERVATASANETNAEYLAACHPQQVIALLDEIERLRQERDACRAERDAMRQAAPVMLTVLALLADEADATGLREAALHYTEHADYDHLALWLDECRALDNKDHP